MSSTVQARGRDTADPARKALCADAAAVCAARLTRVAGTHALLLDACGGMAPVLPGVACWTTLQPRVQASGWRGPLLADAGALPFGDDSFCAVLVRFAGLEGVAPGAIAEELGRVLAPHGVLLVVDLHPNSLWGPDAVAPQRWRNALRQANLDVKPAVRCGAPWPRARGEHGLPRWLVHGFGGAYVVEAHRQVQAAIPLRKAASKRPVEQSALLPGARRQSA